MKLKASPTRQPASRQGAGKGFLCAAIQQTQEWALGSGARCAQLRQQVLRLGCEKPVGERAEEAWNDIPATPWDSAGTMGTNVTFLLQLPSRERRKR